MSIKKEVKSIKLSCISPEAKNLLEELVKEYKKTFRKDPVDDYRFSAYSTLYWACRYGGLCVSPKDGGKQT
jgi:hypothetical protein